MFPNKSMRLIIIAPLLVLCTSELTESRDDSRGSDFSDVGGPSEMQGVIGIEELETPIEGVNENIRRRRHLFEGDIILDKSNDNLMLEDMQDEGTSRDVRRRRQVAIDKAPNRKWSEGVYYTFKHGASQKLKEGFLKAVKAWEENTCINFKEDAEAYDRLYVTDDDGCSSHVGRLGGPQPLSLAKGCEEFGHAAHEVGHALGLYHAQGRHDRDEHITVKQENIKPGFENEYRKFTEEESTNYGTKYDYGSIMHYGSPLQNPTMVAADDNYKRTMGSHMISFTDLVLLNKHYGCEEKCDGEESAICENGGFPHPRRCKECICPGGYGGQLCNMRPGTCGEELEASLQWKTLETIIYSKDGSGDYEKCIYWIKSPSGTVIDVKIETMTNSFSYQGCPKAGVEIKTNEDQTLTGYRFCSDEDEDIELRSHSNLVPIIFYSNDHFWTVIKLGYRYVEQPEQD